MTDTTPAPELKPCPFCGGANMKHTPKARGWSEAICCPCGVDYDGSPDEWNTRADLIPAALAVPEVRALVELLREARADLATYVDADWPEALRESYPPLQAKWKRDMELCWRIDAALKGADHE